jgi:tRNA threonylcarbamoyladenosine biosynthesis protein TsaB
MDTSTELGSVAVVIDGLLCAEIGTKVRARHGETLLPVIGAALEHAGLARRDVELIAVGVGPGSFTGTRIGLATAKGLALALDRPLIGVPSLRAIARAAPGSWIVSVVDAHKGEVYAAAYERVGLALIERVAPFHAEPADAFAALRAVLPREGVVACGSGLRRYPEHVDRALAILPPLFDAPRAAILALEAEERFLAHGPDDRAALEPLYVRPSDAVLPG